MVAASGVLVRRGLQRHGPLERTAGALVKPRRVKQHARIVVKQAPAVAGTRLPVGRLRSGGELGGPPGDPLSRGQLAAFRRQPNGVGD
jgi:hypothetical protein